MQNIGILLLSICRQTGCLLRGHSMGVRILYSSLLRIEALTGESTENTLYEIATLLRWHLFVILLMNLLHHLWRRVLHKLLVILVRLLWGDLMISTLFPRICILLIHLLIILIVW